VDRTLGNAALGCGGLVAILTVASQLVPLPIGGDFVNLALIGLAAAAFALPATVSSHGAGRRRALLGLVLTLSPVALLGYFLLFTVD